MMETKSENRCGLVGIVGPTNSGKSSLMNNLVGAKISIVSPRCQTTYHKISGVMNKGKSQVILVDTPGYQKFPERVARMLNRVADKGSADCDLYLWMFDAAHPSCRKQFRALSEKIKQFAPKERSICVLNKVYLIKEKTELLPLMEEFVKSDLFRDLIPVSVMKGDGIDIIKKMLFEGIPEGEPLFPDDVMTDRSEQFLVSEYVRESIYRTTSEELPYAARVEIESWDNSGKMPMIHAVIHVDSPSQKKIIVGKGGEKLKHIGIKSRRLAERLIGQKICLKLFVHVDKDWRSDKQLIQKYLEIN